MINDVLDHVLERESTYKRTTFATTEAEKVYKESLDKVGGGKFPNSMGRVQLISGESLM